MNRFIRNCLSFLLVLAMIFALIPAVAPMEVQAADTSAADAIQNGVTLHAWNWSFANLKANMEKIANLGYTAIQVPPIQQTKQTTAGSSMSDWWVYYQPVAFCIDDTGNSALGTKAQFESMCEAAHEYGLYVIVDVVANHMADNGTNTIHPNVISDLRDDSSCWHNISQNISNYNDRENITQYCLDGVPDLNTSSTKVQNYVLNYLKECVDAGADGFRFDAVKHIETPDDDESFASDFWPTVINGIKAYDPDVYLYGELLYHPDDANSISDSIYTKYFSVTDNSWSNAVRNNVVCGQNAGNYSYVYHKDAQANQLVLWAESHDTYAGNENSDSVSIENINKTWALVAARADAMSLYLARPENMYPQLLGEVTPGGWDAAEVAAVNKFHNAFVGQSEYVANQNNVAYVERGDSGVVLVNCGGTSASVSVTANVMADGIYKDQITGNTFTVSGGTISGTIGDTGIAVVYNAIACGHETHGTNGRCAACNQYVGHSYADGLCACGKTEPVGLNYYMVGYINGKNHGDGDDYANMGDYSFENGPITVTFTETSYVCVKNAANTTWYMTDGWLGEVTSATLYDSTGLSSADKLQIPGGVAVTIYLEENADGTLTIRYAPANTCTHPSHGTDGVCTDCGETVEHDYVAGQVTREPTCTTTGLTAHSCSICGKTVQMDTAALSHLHDGGCVTQEPTCTLYGVMTYTCSRCGDTEPQSIDPLGHDYVGDICSRCGEAMPTERKLYFRNDAGWSQVNIYYWSDSNTSMTAWPGKAMTNEGSNIFSASIPVEAQYVIFNNGSAQTDDLTVPEDYNIYYHSGGTWAAYNVCPHTSHNVDGLCEKCLMPVDHSWDGGSCACGANRVTIIRQPQSVTVSSGVQAKVTVEVTGDGLTYQWYYASKGSTEFQLTSAFSTNAYYVSMNATRDGRQVYCVVTDRYGNSVQTDTVTLNRDYTLRISQQPQNVTAASGETAKVTFKATGDGLTYRWFYANQGSGSFTYTKSFATNNYAVQMNSSRDGRQVYCEVTDKYGNSVRTETVTLTMYTPLTITQQPASVTVPAGTQAKVTVTARGDGLKYAWYYASAGSNDFKLTQSFKTKSYYISMTEARDGRQVYCVITDKHGNSVRTETVILSMEVGLTITRQPVSVAVAAGEIARVTVAVQGEGLTYQWFYANAGSDEFKLTTAFKGASYGVAMTEARDGRRIYCVITDANGNTVTTDTVTLSMT